MKRDVEIPQQRTDEGQKPKRVITNYVVVLTLDESVVRHRWRGETDEEILANIESESTDEQIQELVDELQSVELGDPKMLFVRHVKIVDPN